jgi:hypothetical protein
METGFLKRSDAVLACDLEVGDRVRTGAYTYWGEAGALVARVEHGRYVYAYDVAGLTIGFWSPGETVWLAVTA